MTLIPPVTPVPPAPFLRRLACDAVVELEGLGLRFHRLRWVAVQANKRHWHDDGRNLLVMSGGEEVPVSRRFRAAARSAGLI